ncbi:MAG: hypothetical protein D6717_02665 [Gammaproteobacteria bacterium]|nr:MAG: hypothetical protein D6717_02665 [Gammaproteobacteria bacterium]
MNSLDHTPRTRALEARLKAALQKHDPTRLAACMGYRGGQRDRALRRLDGLKRTEDLARWLMAPGFDFRYTQEDFFRALVRCLPELDEAEGEVVLAEIRAERERLERLYPAWVLADTGPVRKRGPIFAMAATGTARFIRLDRQRIEDDFCRELARVREIVRRHHAAHEGQIPLWGRIRKYDWHFGDGQVMCLSVKGEPLPRETPQESIAVATLSVK